VIVIDIIVATAIGLGIEIAGLLVMVALILLLAGLANLMDWIWPHSS
jgi:hypothetical protein